MSKNIKLPKAVIINEIETQRDDLFNNNKKHLEKAKQQLELAKEIELEKIAKGYQFMRKEKIAKLVHPDRIAVLQKDGWKLLKQKLKPKKMK